ncbi:hypothetical protein MBLNU230_g7085t1 [Neophaeotheca triangularis]
MDKSSPSNLFQGRGFPHNPPPPAYTATPEPETFSGHLSRDINLSILQSTLGRARPSIVTGIQTNNDPETPPPAYPVPTHTQPPPATTSPGITIAAASRTLPTPAPAPTPRAPSKARLGCSVSFVILVLCAAAFAGLMYAYYVHDQKEEQRCREEGKGKFCFQGPDGEWALDDDHRGHWWR